MARHAPSWLESKTLDLESRASKHTTALRVWHILNHAVEGFINNNDLLRASALTFTVALSIVPILALAFSAVKGFGGAERLRPMVERYLGLGSSSSQLMSYVENVNAAALGSAGGAFLLITVISTMGTVEQALNTIFNVPQSRSYFRKFSDYLSVLFTVPFLILAALGFTAVFSVRISEFPFITHLLPYLFVWAGFFFLYIFFPYTKVRYGPALIGSFVTAVLFQLAQWGYVRFQVGVANYRAIYGAMATLPVFLVWLYIAWSIILFGAELTASIQRGDIPPMLGPMSPDFLYSATMHILIRLADRAYRGGDDITSWTLSHELFVPEATLKPILDGLKIRRLCDRSRPEHRFSEPGSVSCAPVFDDRIGGRDQGRRVRSRREGWRSACRPRPCKDGCGAQRPAQNDYARRYPFSGSEGGRSGDGGDREQSQSMNPSRSRYSQS